MDASNFYVCLTAHVALISIDVGLGSESSGALLTKLRDPSTKVTTKELTLTVHLVRVRNSSEAADVI